jgi:3-hydroxyacyl-CoA dehydrogenase/enoyl-CoA hydratase/3-hydroxybutyryl-CoA epimerase
MIIRQEGVPVEAIDAAAEEFGMPMGPVELADTVGLDVCVMVTNTLGAQQGISELQSKANAHIQSLVEAGHLGRKSGQGFYRWENDKPIKQLEKVKGHDTDAIRDRLLKAYIEECKSALRDGIVSNEDLLDAGMIFGTGFPPFRGGPMHYLKTQKGER